MPLARAAVQMAMAANNWKRCSSANTWVDWSPLRPEASIRGGLGTEATGGRGTSTWGAVITPATAGGGVGVGGGLGGVAARGGGGLSLEMLGGWAGGGGAGTSMDTGCAGPTASI